MEHFLFPRLLAIIVVFSSMSYPAAAQQKAHTYDRGREIRNSIEMFVEERTDIPFPDLDTLPTINNPPFYFKNINKPTMIYFGIDGCTPCHFEMPFMVKLANSEKYRNYNFVYISYDDSATICDHLKDQTPENLKRLYLMIMPKSLINDDKLTTCGYPTKYFIDTKGITRKVITGGYIENEDILLTEWSGILDALH